MSTTTAALIRDRMLSLVDALTPMTDATRFRHFREEGDFRAWAQSQPTACLRRFSILDVGQYRPALVSNTDVELRRALFETVIAYPMSGRFGRNQLGVEDVIEQDMHQVEHTIGMRGYGNFTAASGAEAAWVEGETAREVAGRVRLLVIVQTFEFYRSMP
jgi:hypothetical protein